MYIILTISIKKNLTIYPTAVPAPGPPDQLKRSRSQGLGDVNGTGGGYDGV